MTVGIHQPNYLPWLGYFFKMVLSDIFIFHDAVPLSKRTYTRRTHILREKGSSEKRWLTVPLKKHASDTRCSEVEIDQAERWELQHLHKIANAYAHKVHFEEINSDLKLWLEQCRAFDLLAEMNAFLIKAIADKLGIECTYRHSSRMQNAGAGAALNASLVQEVGGQTYISGSGGKNYQDAATYTESGVQLVYHRFEEWTHAHPYGQDLEAFVPGLSIVDCLMHCGWEGTAQRLAECRSAWQVQSEHNG